VKNSKYIILDRDGVINIDSLNYIKSADEWNAIPKSLEAIKKLTKHEYQVIIISNQSGLGRGIIPYSDFIQINLKMLKQINRIGGSILAILYCPSLPTDECINRKPGTGMFSEISERLSISLTECYAIGDSPRDIEAALSSECKPLGLRTGNGKDIESNLKYDIPMFNDLSDAVDYVIKNDANN
jgi:D-glycero-D-manno-heptose 1,7-bisphosphate phosphatase|tara:strand:+ start:160 stop:711 length:552 start_codon:yes stop_codon:yes gene_type:complete